MRNTAVDLLAKLDAQLPRLVPFPTPAAVAETVRTTRDLLAVIVQDLDELRAGLALEGERRGES